MCERFPSKKRKKRKKDIFINVDDIYNILIGDEEDVVAAGHRLRLEELDSNEYELTVRKMVEAYRDIIIAHPAEDEGGCTEMPKQCMVSINLYVHKDPVVGDAYYLYVGQTLVLAPHGDGKGECGKTLLVNWNVPYSVAVAIVGAFKQSPNMPIH